MLFVTAGVMRSVVVGSECPGNFQPTFLGRSRRAREVISAGVLVL